MEKIHYLCSKISEVDWSGILLYSVKGSIKEPKNEHEKELLKMLYKILSTKQNN